jgi:hypothetical protein
MVRRNGGDAGTVIHTSVPFGIAATMTFALPLAELSRCLLELLSNLDKRVPGKLPGTESGGGNHQATMASPFLIREMPGTSTAKILRLGTVITLFAHYPRWPRSTPGGGPQHQMTPADPERLLVGPSRSAVTCPPRGGLASPVLTVLHCRHRSSISAQQAVRSPARAS